MDRGDAIRRAKRLVADEGATMAARYEGGEYLREIALDYGLTLGTVARAIRSNGGTVRRPGFGSIPQRAGRNGRWRGGIHVNSDGYRLVKIGPEHPFAAMAQKQWYVHEHRLVMAEMVKRPLLPDETVHHIDGDRLNNDPSNLQLRAGRHGKGTHWRCGDCGSQNVVAARI